jgi:hypothetical protein
MGALYPDLSEEGALNIRPPSQSAWETNPRTTFLAAMRGRGLFGAMAMREQDAMKQQQLQEEYQRQQQQQQFIRSQPITGDTPAAQLRSKAIVYEKAGLLGQAKQLSQMANDLEPHETFGGPTTVLQNGQPRLALPGSRGNMRVVEGASPYERGDEAELGRILDQAGIKDEALRQPIFKALADKKVSHAPGVTIHNQAETAYATTVGKGVGQDDVEEYKSALKAVEGVTLNRNLLKHLRANPDMNTGLFAEMKQGIDRLKVLAAQNEKAGKRVSDTEVVNSMLGSQVFPMIGELGIGARGLDTPKEVAFLRGVMTGTIEMQPATLIKMAEMRMDASKRSIEKINARIDRGELDDFFRYAKKKKSRIELPANDDGDAPAAPVAPVIDFNSLPRRR